MWHRVSWNVQVGLSSCLSTGSVQFSSVAPLCPTLCDPMNRSMPGLPVQHQLPESTQTHVHRVDDAIQPSYPLLPPSPLPSIFPSIRVFSDESSLRIRWPKYWSFSFSNSLPMNIQDWFPLGLTGLISLLSKELSRVFSNTTVWKHQSAPFFIVQCSHSYMTTGKTIILTIWNFVGKVMSLLFNTLSLS